MRRPRDLSGVERANPLCSYGGSPTNPVSGPAVCVGDGQNLDPALRLTEDNKEREAAEKISPCVAEVRRPLARRLLDLIEGGIELRHERLGDFSIPGLVPLPGGTCFCDCLEGEPRRVRLALPAEDQATSFRPGHWRNCSRVEFPDSLRDFRRPRSLRTLIGTLVETLQQRGRECSPCLRRQSERFLQELCGIRCHVPNSTPSPYASAAICRDMPREPLIEPVSQRYGCAGSTSPPSLPLAFDRRSANAQKRIHPLTLPSRR